MCALLRAGPSADKMTPRGEIRGGAASKRRDEDEVEYLERLLERF